MFRNPTAHEPGTHRSTTLSDVEDLLSLVSRIRRRLDAAHMSARI
jgi:hypothetical protein